MAQRPRLAGPEIELPSFLPLTALYVGRFASTNHACMFLWVPGLGPKTGVPKRLVLVVVQDENGQQPAKTLQRSFFRNSPFFAPASDAGDLPGPLRGVCTFEIALGDIAGLDYWNPLLVDASRFVVEARRLTSRWFPNLDSCSQYFGWQELPGSPRRSSDHEHGCQLASIMRDLYRPSAGSDGRSPGLQQVVPQTENCRLHMSPSKAPQTYWQDRAEEVSYRRLNKVVLTAERMLRVKHRSPTRRSLEDELNSADSTPRQIGRPNSESATSIKSSCPTEHDGDGGTGGGAGTELAVEDVFTKQPDPALQILCNVTIHFRFDDPFLPYVLREIVHDPEHPNLLRLCEAGLPAWAIVIPQYTSLYRRWMRLLVAAVVLLLSCVSMLLGFYDLYKRIPLVRQLLKQVLGPLSSRLEELVVVRLSVLLGWMLPYSAIFRRAYDGFRVCFDVVREMCVNFAWSVAEVSKAAGNIVVPFVSVITQPLVAIATAARAMWRACAIASRGGWWAIITLGGTLSGSGPPSVVSTTTLLHAEFKMVRQAFMGVYNSTCFLGAKVAKHQASMRLAFARWRARMRHRLVEAVKRRPICTIFFVMLLALIMHPPSAVPGVGHSGAWARNGSVSRWLLQLKRSSSDSPLAFIANVYTLHFVSQSCRAAHGGMAHEISTRSFERHGGAQQLPWYWPGRSWWSCVWNGWLAPNLCPRFCPVVPKVSRRLPQPEPKLSRVELLCAKGESNGDISSITCWTSREGGRRCRCPQHSLHGFNVSSDRPGWQLSLAAPWAKGFGNGTALHMPCQFKAMPSGQHGLQQSCIVTPPSLLADRWLSGGAVELFGLAAGHHAALASFVLEAPAQMVTLPWGVHLCAERTAQPPWRELVPSCNPAARRLTDTSGDGRGLLRVSWHQDSLGSCRRPEWSVSLQFSRPRRSKFYLCRSLGGRAGRQMSCSGEAPAASELLLGTVQAVVTLTCQDKQPAHVVAAESLRYALPLAVQEKITSLSDSSLLWPFFAWWWLPILLCILAGASFILGQTRLRSKATLPETARVSSDAGQTKIRSDAAVPEPAGASFDDGEMEIRFDASLPESAVANPDAERSKTHSEATLPEPAGATFDAGETGMCSDATLRETAGASSDAVRTKTRSEATVPEPAGASSDAMQTKMRFDATPPKTAAASSNAGRTKTRSKATKATLPQAAGGADQDVLEGDDDR
eukprot:TRINITY_DN27190_c0_g1_i1.p1 TRINITY_DN27190_c0_g1~~TRINITY_DN27190_c0_g1_i1.p1  ORF type:complete len:1200 (-),score=168.23 TRINITY_DN27190_c0_g1_i1:53-3652(-)